MLTRTDRETPEPGRLEPPTFSILSEGDDLVLHVQGSLDASTAPGVRKRLGIMRDLTGGGRLIVDLRDAQQLDPSVIEAVRTAEAHCRTIAVEFLLRNPSPTVASALRELSR